MLNKWCHRLLLELSYSWLFSIFAFCYLNERNQIYSTTLKWAPIFEPDAATLSSIGDGAIKINQAVPGYFGKENLKELTGINYSQDASSTPNLDDMYKDDLNE